MTRRTRTLGLLAAAALACVAGPVAGVTPALASPSFVVTPAAAFEAETMALPTSLGRVYADAAASGGRSLLIWSNGAATKAVTTSIAASDLRVRVRGSECNGSPTMSVRIDGVQVFHGPVSASYLDWHASVNVPAGAHRVTVALTNDLRTRACDRNLYVDRVALTGWTSLPWEPLPPPAGT